MVNSGRMGRTSSWILVLFFALVSIQKLVPVYSHLPSEEIDRPQWAYGLGPPGPGRSKPPRALRFDPAGDLPNDASEHPKIIRQTNLNWPLTISAAAPPFLLWWLIFALASSAIALIAIVQVKNRFFQIKPWVKQESSRGPSVCNWSLPTICNDYVLTPTPASCSSVTLASGAQMKWSPFPLQGKPCASRSKCGSPLIWPPFECLVYARSKRYAPDVATQCQGRNLAAMFIEVALMQAVANAKP
eukprot:GHVT01086782.1.p1 GENE.GHVT01086782.1~~GHVT01086782.1.p1  ORF type:complete len:244 (+),score=6.33 GHVT01086782.1:149-880(+)